MDLISALREVGRYGEERDLQVFDQAVAEVFLQAGVDAMAFYQANNRKAVVG
jgi:hypothetical protein